MLWLVTASAAAAHLSPLVATMPTPRLARATPPVMQYGGGRDMYDDRDMYERDMPMMGGRGLGGGMEGRGFGGGMMQGARDMMQGGRDMMQGGRMNEMMHERGMPGMRGGYGEMPGGYGGTRYGGIASMTTTPGGQDQMGGMPRGMGYGGRYDEDLMGGDRFGMQRRGRQGFGMQRRGGGYDDRQFSQFDPSSGFSSDIGNRFGGSVAGKTTANMQGMGGYGGYGSGYQGGGYGRY